MDKSAELSIDPSDDFNDGVLLGEKTGTLSDKKDMARLGKEQLFKVGLHDCTDPGLLTYTRCSATLALCQYLDLP